MVGEDSEEQGGRKMGRGGGKGRYAVGRGETVAVVIPDDVLREAGLSDDAPRVEIACRLFGADFFNSSRAARLAGLGRVEFWRALESRGLPIVHIGGDHLDDFKDLMVRGTGGSADASRGE